MKEVYGKGEGCTIDNIKTVETITVHLSARIERMSDKQMMTQLRSIRERLMKLHGEIVAFYSKSPPDLNVPNIDRAPTNTKNKNSRVQTQPDSEKIENQTQELNLGLNQMAIIDLIERTVNGILDRRSPSHVSGNIIQPQRHYDRAERIYDRSYEHFRNHAQSCDHRSGRNILREDWYDDNHSRDAYDFFPPPPTNRDNFRPSSTRHHDFIYPNSNRVNVMDWRFHFSGLDRSEDSKAMDVEAFIEKIRDHSQAEGMSERELMSKIQQLLRGPASDWYSYAVDQLGRF